MISGIQIIGTQRSGSNLLRVMMHQSSHISAPHPPHILHTFFPILEMYGDLKVEHNFRNLVSDVYELIRLNPVDWKISFGIQEILDRCENYSLPQALKAVYELKAMKKDAHYWCCKSMANVRYFSEMERDKVQPFYIYLYRDGRDVALSFKKAVVGEKHIYHLAKQWKQDQLMALNLGEQIGEKRFFRISYEDLTKDPKAVLSELCNRLSIPFETSMLDYYRSDESKDTAHAGNMWNNLVKPVMKHNSHKFVNELSQDEIVIFESIAADMLETLGYMLINSRSLLRNNFTAEEVDTFCMINKTMKETVRENLTLDMEKRKAQEDFIHKLYNDFYSFEELNKQ
jgi:hypothetical protein